MGQLDKDITIIKDNPQLLRASVLEYLNSHQTNEQAPRCFYK